MHYKSIAGDSTLKDQFDLWMSMWRVKPDGTMIIAKKSPITGLDHFAQLAITAEQVREYINGAKVQQAFPNLNEDEREFILSGIVPKEWDETFQDID